MDEDLNDQIDVKLDVKSNRMSAEEKVKEQNRIRKMAMRAREKLPKYYKSFCLVTAHLVKNAHRYYPEEKVKNDKMKDEEKCTTNQEQSGDGDQCPDPCKEVNQWLREIWTLKKQNRIREQQDFVTKLKAKHGSYQSLNRISGVPLKTIHCWCSIPKNCEHKGTVRAQMKHEEFTNFLMQDTISYSDPCKKFSGKKFLMYTWDEIYKRYQQQKDFHKHGLISRTAMQMYKSKYILLSGATPANHCLCDICENCDLLRKALLAAGLKQIPAKKYQCTDATLCSVRQGKFGTDYFFPPIKCVDWQCMECGVSKLKALIECESNAKLLKLNNRVTWHRWQKVEGHSVPRKLEIKGSLRAAVNEFLDVVKDISDHLFRANWHRNVFQYIKAHLLVGYLLQVMDFVMNFSNHYQDEVQSAYYSAT